MNKNAIRRRRRGSSGSLAGTLFSASEPGFTFEPWDITTLYQDRAGTIPVTAAGQSVGYRRDKSGNGNHEVAISDAKRGVYGWMPKTGRRNLLTYTEQFDNAVWGKTNATVTANAEIAPDGNLTADKVEVTGAAPNVSRDIVVNSTSVTLSAYFKKGTGATSANALLIRNQTLGTNLVAARVNLDTGAITYILGSSGAVSESAGNGWWKLTLTASITSGNTVRSGILGGYTATVGDFSFIWGAQLENGSTATAYQRVNLQYDITEAGVPTCYYVQADGVDDAYVTPTITPNTDKAQIFMGLQKLVDTGGMLVELSASAGPNAGTFYMLSGPDTGPLGAVNGYSSLSRGSAVADALQTAQIVQAAPNYAVVTSTHDIAGDLSTIRRNGVAGTSGVADKGTGNFLAYPAYIYGRGGTSLPFNGLDFGHAVRFGPNLDAATIARVEALIARNTPGVTL